MINHYSLYVTSLSEPFKNEENKYKYLSFKIRLTYTPTNINQTLDNTVAVMLRTLVDKGSCRKYAQSKTLPITDYAQLFRQENNLSEINIGGNNYASTVFADIKIPLADFINEEWKLDNANNRTDVICNIDINKLGLINIDNIRLEDFDQQEK